MMKAGGVLQIMSRSTKRFYPELASWLMGQFSNYEPPDRATVRGENSGYLADSKPFTFFPLVYHYKFGAGYAKEYRGNFWYIDFVDNPSLWINKQALRIIAV